MRKSMALVAGVAVLSVVSSASVSGGGRTPPVGGWGAGLGVEKGVVSIPSYCNGSEFSCAVVASGLGFLQLKVGVREGLTSPILNHGEYFIQTIVTDQNASGASGNLGFQDVTFVKMSLVSGSPLNNTQNGIYGEQLINQPGGNLPSRPPERFMSATTIATGWGLADPADPSVQIDQRFLGDGGDDTTQSDDFISSFRFQATLDAVTGIRNGFTMDISQLAGLGAPSGSKGDVQSFSLRERQGTFNPTANRIGVMVDYPSLVTWAANDDMKAIWIGQFVDLTTILGGVSGSSGTVGLGSSFGYASFENLSVPAGGAGRLTANFGFDKSNAAGAWVWDPAFGRKPVICSPEALLPGCTLPP